MINKQDKQDKYIDFTLKAMIILCLIGLLISMTNLFLKLKSKENKYVNQIMLLEVENTMLFEENEKIKNYYFMLTDCCNENQLKEYNKEYNNEKNY